MELIDQILAKYLLSAVLIHSEENVIISIVNNPFCSLKQKSKINK